MIACIFDLGLICIPTLIFGAGVLPSLWVWLKKHKVCKKTRVCKCHGDTVDKDN